MKGKLVILSNELPFYQKSVIEMELQDDILFHYNKIESLIWEFGNIDQRYEALVHKHKIKLPFIVKRSEFLRERLKKTNPPEKIRRVADK
jgi:hypothetical protein